MSNEYEVIQNKTFCKWLNARLVPAGYSPLTNLTEDFCDGTKLIQLIETLTETSLGRYNVSPVMKVQKAENVIIALSKIKSLGIMLTNIGAEDIVDGNLKLILGLIWSLVLRFTIAQINEEGSHAKEGLLLWCQRRTIGYDEVDIVNFTKGWSDGLALCALIHHHRPDLLDYSKLSKLKNDRQTAIENTSIAFRIAEKNLGIPMLLEIEDLVGTKKPDERSVMTYVAQFFHAFTSKAREESQINVISTFTEDMTSLMAGIHDYERQAQALIDSLDARSLFLQTPPSATTYAELKRCQSELESYATTTRGDMFDERLRVIALLGHIQTKLGTYGLKRYDPKKGLCLADIDGKWAETSRLDEERCTFLSHSIRDMQERVRERSYEEKAALDTLLLQVVERLSKADQSLEDQLADLSTYRSSTAAQLSDTLSAVQSIEQLCQQHDVVNTSPYTYESLKRRLNACNDAVGVKSSFLENQIAARAATKVAPEQLEDFESAFRAFDKHAANGLDNYELEGALSSLGIGVGEGIEDLHAQLRGDDGLVRFDSFLNYAIERHEKGLTPARFKDCFRGMAENKSYVTELDLHRVSLPTSSIDFLMKHMPEYVTVPPPEGINGRDAEEAEAEGRRFDYTEFLEELFLL